MTYETLNEKAFGGHSVFLLEAALTLDWDRTEPLPVRERHERYVYFIGRKEGPIKIGVANEPHTRLSGFQVAHCERLYIYAITPGDEKTEREIHNEFHHNHVRGEWFERSEELLRRIILLQDQEREIYAHLLQTQQYEATS